MKFTITMKDPDGSSDCLGDAAEQELPEGLDEDEREMLIESRREKLSDFVSQWLEYGESARIEFDTEAKTATLLKGR